MKVSTYTRLLSLGLTFLLLAACSAEDGDLIPPDVAYNGGVSPTTSTSVTLTGTMDPDAVITAEATTTDDVVVNPLSPTGVWECTVTGMIEGANDIFVSATDPVGNTRLLQITIVVDLTGPTTTIDQYPLVAPAGTYTFAGTVNEPGSSVLVEVLDLSDAVVASGTAVVDADIWTAGLDLIALADADYMIVATGTDRLGNTSTTPAEQMITVDSTSASFSIAAVSPATGLPAVLNVDEDSQLFDGTAPAGSTLSVTPVSLLTPPDIATGDWDATVAGIPAGKTIVTFDLNNGSTLQKVLIVRDQTAPTVVEWTSAFNDSVTVEFNESMNIDTIQPENLVVVDSTETEITVLSVAQNSDHIFTFTTELMPAAASYTATLQIPADCSVGKVCTVEDTRGNPLGTSYIWRFNK